MLKPNRLHFIKFSLTNVENILNNIGEEATEEAIATIRETSDKISAELSSILPLLQDMEDMQDMDEYPEYYNLYVNCKSRYEAVVERYNKAVSPADRIIPIREVKEPSFCCTYL